MVALGRAVGIFVLMVAMGYTLVALALPRPSPAAPDVAPGGRIAASRLSHEAHFLMGQRQNGPAR